MKNHQLLTRKAVKLPETDVMISQALVGAECIIWMHHFEVLHFFVNIYTLFKQK